MEDSAPLSSSSPSLSLHPSTAAKAKKLQDTRMEPSLCASQTGPTEKADTPPALQTSALFLDALEKLKMHPAPAVQELKPPPSPEHPRIEAIKRGEELLLKEGWPSAEDLDQVAHILGEHFE